ncbi:MAG TPA: alpha/beta hydrolase [Thermoplasmata archaeon]|nr:alpha/beta hydrolase [Thermoplasmata archaeon]
MLAFTSAGPTREPRVVLLHGWPLDSSIWSEVVRHLADGGLHVLCPDLPGFGSSPPVDAGRATVEAYADDVAAFLQHFGDRRVALAGHSFGGYVALAFAERHPDLLAGLGLVSSRTIADSEAARKGRHETIDKVRTQGSRALLPDLARKLLAPSAPQPLVDRATRILERTRPEGIIAGLAAMAARPNRTEVLESYLGPVLVVHGREDQLIPEREAASPKASRAVVREILPAAGHMPMWEDPHATAQAILRWARAAFEG